MDIMEQIRILEQNRDEIQKVDLELVELLNYRMRLCESIMKLKRNNGKKLYAPIVEAEKIEFLSCYSEFEGMVEAIWPVMMCYARTLS